jgi:uncharacterized membrane protein
MNFFQKLWPSATLRQVPWQRVSYVVAGGLLAAWLLNTPEGLLGKADAIGYAVCHRIDVRSFHLGDRPISLCARCTGQYLGAMLGLVFQLIRRPRAVGRPPWYVILVLGLIALLYALDGTNSYLYLLIEMSDSSGAEMGNILGWLTNFSSRYGYVTNNTLRLLTGTGLGIGVGVMLLPAFHQTVWKVRDRRAAIDGWLPLAGLLALGFVLDLVVLTENPIILYPLALVSAAGVMVLLTMVYSMVWLMLFKMENRIENARQLIFPLVAGFTIALLQIAAIDYVRYLFTGTWDGFHFG